MNARHAVRDVYMDEKKLRESILDIVFATRFPSEYKLGKLTQLIQYDRRPVQVLIWHLLQRLMHL